MKAKERILVTITSWHKRINNVHAVLDTILKQTLLPNEIILNLCIQDFPNMEDDLPADLLEFIASNPIIRIYWYIENYKPWKKHLYVLDYASEEDIIISIDDDHLYPTFFIEQLYISFCFYGKKHPVTLNNLFTLHRLWTYNGPGTLYQKNHLIKDYKKFFSVCLESSNLLGDTLDDVWLTFLMAANEVYVLPNMFIYPFDNTLLYNDNNVFSDVNRVENETKHSEIRKMTSNNTKFVLESFDKFYFSKNPFEQYNYISPNLWRLSVNIYYIIKNKKDYIFPAEQVIIDLWTKKNENEDKSNLESNTWIPYDSVIIKNRVCIPRHDKTYYIGENNKLIVTLSSWPERINNCYEVLQTILYNTILPDEIILNLAKPDFNALVNVQEDSIPDLDSLVKLGKFPADLLDLIKNNDIIKIVWYDKSEYKSWKKYIYACQHYAPNDVIITIDDDCLYKETFIETMIKSYHEYNREYPVTGISSINSGCYGLNGSAFLFTPKFMNFCPDLYPEEVLYMQPEDSYIQLILAYNRNMVLPCIGTKYLISNYHYNESNSNFGNGVFSEQWFEQLRKIQDMASDVLAEQYNKNNIDTSKFMWNPFFFNITVQETINFVEKHKNSEGMIKVAADTLNNILQEGGIGKVYEIAPEPISNYAQHYIL